MKKLTILITFLLLSSLSLPALAQQKIGYVDLQRVVSNSAYSERLRKELQKDLKPMQNQLETLTVQIAQLRQKLAKDAATMNQKQQYQLQKQIRNKVYEAKIREASFKEEAQYREQEALDKVGKRALKELEKIAKQEGYALIVHKEAVMYAVEAVDVTNQLTKALR